MQALVSKMYKVSASLVNGRKREKKSFVFSDNNLDSFKVNNLIFLFLMPQRRFFSQFLIGDEIIMYFSFVFVSSIVSCLALPSRKSLRGVSSLTL